MRNKWSTIPTTLQRLDTFQCLLNDENSCYMAFHMHYLFLVANHEIKHSHHFMICILRLRQPAKDSKTSKLWNNNCLDLGFLSPISWVFQIIMMLYHKLLQNISNNLIITHFFYYCFGVITLYICMFGLFVLFLCLCIALDYQFVVMPLLRLSDSRCWLESLCSGIVYCLPSNILRRSWHALFWNKHCLLYDRVDVWHIEPLSGLL